MVIDFHYMLESAPCRAVLMLAKHLDIELNLKILNFQKKEHLKEEFIKVKNFRNKFLNILINPFFKLIAQPI